MLPVLPLEGREPRCHFFQVTNCSKEIREKTEIKRKAKMAKRLATIRLAMTLTMILYHNNVNLPWFEEIQFRSITDA